MAMACAQVMKENAKDGSAPAPASEKTPENLDKVSALVLSARRLAARSQSPHVKASKSLTESFNSPARASN